MNRTKYQEKCIMFANSTSTAIVMYTVCTLLRLHKMLSQFLKATLKSFSPSTKSRNSCLQHWSQRKKTRITLPSVCMC